MYKALEIVTMPTNIYEWQIRVGKRILAESSSFFHNKAAARADAKPIIDLIKKDKNWSVVEILYNDQTWVKKSKHEFIGGK